MILLIDAGNSRIKWALAVDADTETGAANADVARPYGVWRHSGAVAREDWAQLPAIWRDAGIEAPLRRILASNVAGADLRRQLDTLPALLSAAPELLPPQARSAAIPAIEWLVSQAALGGLQNGYRQPAQLGNDRFASSIGARALFPGESLIVVTCGTATTIDAIEPSGRFTGGLILPGLTLMTGALALNTAQLPQLTQRQQLSRMPAAGETVTTAGATVPFADNTEQAIAAGCIAAQIGAIEMAMRRQQQAFPATRCLLAGGAAIYLAPYLALPHERFDNLVLTGLQVLAAAGPLQPPP